MSQKVEILAKVIKEMDLTVPELDELIRKIDSLFWDKAGER